MANELRVFQDFLGGQLDAAIDHDDTTLSSPAFAAMVEIDTTNHIVLALDPDGIGGEPEKVKVTAHAAGATTCTVERGYEGSAGGGRAHADSTDWVAPLVASDLENAGGSTYWALKTFVDLTNKTTWGADAITPGEQWGTEEATVPLASLPAAEDIVVSAWLSGDVRNVNETDGLLVRVEISLDGGSTWTGAGNNATRFGSASPNNRADLSSTLGVGGTATGDVMARAIAQAAKGSTSVQQLTNGKILMEVSSGPLV